MNSHCRICGTQLVYTFVDLGQSPLANAFLTPEELGDAEPYYPLHSYVCDTCCLVQLDQFASPASIFKHYLYLSSYSTSWLKHAEQYTDMAIRRFQLNGDSQVIEIASNDGYLLQYFHQQGIRTLGIEPASNVAQLARDKGIPTKAEFFGQRLAEDLVKDEGISGNLIVANNVLAHVPDVQDFVAGLKRLLHPEGTITIEFPHVLNLIRYKQFDTIYHEHFSYFSLFSAQQLFSMHGLQVTDVEELSTHGGSLRLYIMHEDKDRLAAAAVQKVLEQERQNGLHDWRAYTAFAQQVEQMREDIIRFMMETRNQGKLVAGYGAPAKGNTLLNYCGFHTAWLPFTVDQNPYKQGLYLPGSRIPIHNPEELKRVRPDYVLILPWNLKEEIMEQCAYIREWGGKFVIFVPEIEVV
ncbi:class I SAM-dependent methyltransferase [Paenibacillus alvei]|uniref:class I SAM-dependent methyltransferase n=1 Tax=Paenibacillus alvei TaxID=44250 RepID=UPI00227FEDF3|nr:class I SAM-dependent methyltransferase [Paenibacillus alvei]